MLEFGPFLIFWNPPFRKFTIFDILLLYFTSSIRSISHGIVTSYLLIC